MLCDRCGNDSASRIIYLVDGNKKVYLCDTCNEKYESQNKINKFLGISKIEQGTKLILEGLRDEFGLDINDPNFTDTPKRVARAYYEICEGINAKQEIESILSTSFPSQYDGMIVAKDIVCWSLCPHHLLPVEYKVNFGYIPSEQVLGISKLSRLVELLAKQPKLQEDFTNDIVEILECNIHPKGIIVQVNGRHTCMVMRGAKQTNSWTLTSKITGDFKNAETRNEFQMLIG